ncbi:MAG: hypothetical protein HY265_07645, partial [Deltaproteobacteria bacterium]|nr:hypothetical protein [Deltaproteobacteria bacterium]
MNLKKVAIIYNDDLDMMQADKQDIASWQGVVDTAEKVEAALNAEGLSTVLIPLKNDIEGFVKTLKKENADIIFNLCEGAMGKSAFEMNVAAILELFDFKFTGSGSLTLGLALNKGMAKGMFHASNIPIVPYLVLKEVPSRLAKALRFPLMVKPVQEDASVGIGEDAV